MHRDLSKTVQNASSISSRVHIDKLLRTNKMVYQCINPVTFRDTNNTVFLYE